MQQDRDIGLYLHVPLCRQRCHFCAFYLEIATPARIDAYLSALERELTLYRQQNLLAERAFQSIYFGGGTPTVIPGLRLAALLGHIRNIYSVAPDAEVTVEAHPSTVTLADLRALAKAGFNRVSLGAESMAPQDFIPIGRPGTVSETEQAVEHARTAGFSNINLDLMYGLPGQSLVSWTTTVQSLLQLNPTHISCYALTVEDDTKLAHDIARGLVPAPDEVLQVEMEAAAETVLTQAGFTRYEVSNYARPKGTEKTSNDQLTNYRTGDGEPAAVDPAGFHRDRRPPRVPKNHRPAFCIHGSPAAGFHRGRLASTPGRCRTGGHDDRRAQQWRARCASAHRTGPGDARSDAAGRAYPGRRGGFFAGR